jgi:hypothetical protein
MRSFDPLLTLPTPGGELHALFRTGAGVYTPEFTLHSRRGYTPAPQCTAGIHGDPGAQCADCANYG